MVIILFILGIIGIIFGLCTIFSDDFEDIFLAPIILLIGGITTIMCIHSFDTNYHKKQPQTIYTVQDIIYVYPDSLKSESGIYEVKNGQWRDAYIELLTATTSRCE